MEYEECRSNLVQVSEYYQSNKDDRNEASTRLQLINRILFECLSWEEDDCVAEERENGKYTDYTLSTIKRVLIVEAKKEGLYFELPEGVNSEIYKISSLLRDYGELGSAIEQAMGYCQRRGVQIGCV